MVVVGVSLPWLGSAEQHLQTIRVPGTRVTLAVPSGFAAVEYGTALHVPNTNAWIRISEIRIPAEERIRATRRGLAKTPGVLEQREVQIGPYPGLYIRAKVPARSMRVWTVIFGSDRESVRIIATGPEQLEPVMGPTYETMLLHAQWDARYPLNPFDALPFVLPANRILKFASRSGAELTFSREGKIQATSPDEPLLVVTTVSRRVDPEKRDGFCDALIRSVGIFSDLRTLATGPIQADGMKGCELLAQGINRGTKRPGLIYEAVLFESARYYAFKGIAGVRWRAQYVAEFARIARLITRR